jgi:diacylglycerol kinase (ATP)
MRTPKPRSPLANLSARIAPVTRSRSIQIVVTPGSGNGRALPTAQALREGLRARRYPASLKVFADLGSLRRWAATERASASLLICVGGDSTQSTTAEVAVRRSVPFLSVPCGFGNLFAEAIGAPRNVTEVLDRLRTGQVVHADVGMRNGELFLCQESYGLIADVQEDVEGGGAAPRARWQRSLAYYRAALRHLGRQRIPRRRVVVDGRVVARDAALVIVANATAYGTWLPLTPDASLVDGLFDVFVMRAASHQEVVARLLLHQLGIPEAWSEKAMVYRGRRVRVSGPRRQCDVLKLIPGGLPIVVSPSTAARLARERRRSTAPAGAVATA